MRAAFIDALTELAQSETRIVLLTADLGYMVLERFAERFPDRFFNVGVAEQNMVGMATGLAEAGLLPFVYSVANFSVLRPYEFIRNGPVLHGLPVRIVGIGGGLDYGPNGPSHHSVEDIGALRMLPGITIVAPADGPQARTALLRTWGLPSPVYYRIGKDEKPPLEGLDGRFEVGHVQLVREGRDLALLAVGPVAAEAAAAADLLERDGISAAVAVVAAFQPDPAEDLADILSRCRVALTVEAHAVVGGLGSLVAETIAVRGLPCRLVRCGIRGTHDGLSGAQDWLLEKHGLSAAVLAGTARAALAPPNGLSSTGPQEDQNRE